MVSISPAQLRAARGLLNWSREDLAAASGLHPDAILKIEKGVSQPHRGTIEKLVSTLQDHNVALTEDGVRIRRDVFREISPPDAYLKLLDDAFLTLKDSNGEILFFYVDNELSSEEVINNAIRMRRNGIRFRMLINENKPYCLFPLREYRAIPEVLFHNNPILVYADKVGVVIDSPTPTETDNSSCYIVRNASYANAMRLIFEALWQGHKTPAQSTAPASHE